MVAEFQRWGLSRFRKLTGSLEVLGGIGLLVGYFFSQVLVLASSGLALLMLLGLVARFRTHDSLLESLPAGVLMITNVFLLIAALGLLPTT